MTHTEPKRGPGRPRTKNPIQAPSTTAKRGPGRPRKPVNAQTQLDDSSDLPTVNLKDKLTLKELKFIELFVTGEHKRDQAMILAGYGDYHPTYRRLLACRIITKYESQAEDHRIIARALGAGEVFVISGLMELAKNGKSEIVKRAALGDLAKILGLTKEILEGAGGVTIIFEGSGQPAALPGAPPPFPTGDPRPATARPAPGKPMMITK